MAIDEVQLETWSHQGSITQSSGTYKTIKDTLEAPASLYSNRNYRVFLQGSYGNDTNIWTESDVDVVIALDDCFHSDIAKLTETEKAAYESAFHNAVYTHSDFKRDVLSVLTDKFGNAAIEGDKAISVAADGNRRKADVLAAIQYRRYYKFNDINDQSYDEGICFWNSAGDRVANYPRQHSANLTLRHQSTQGWLKPMIRVLKNVRGRCITEGLLDEGIAPSYYLEGLLYNVPPEKFTKSYQQCFLNAFKWIQEEADKNTLVCANEQYYLLRDNSDTCWPEAHGEAFINAAIELWNNW